MVVESSGTAGLEPASTLEGPGVSDVTAVTAGAVSVSVSVAPGTVGTVVDPVHLVQMVEVEVRVTVETVVPVVTTEDPPVVMVLVTGQVVTVV